MKIRHYTLVEIMIVVGIIAILAGLALPVLNSVQRTAKLNKAAAECNAIAIAIKNFETEYGQMPNPGSDNATGAPKPNVDDFIYSPTENKYVSDVNNLEKKTSKELPYRTFFSMLIGYQYSDPTEKTKVGENGDEFHNNTKKMAFLDPTSAYAEEPVNKQVKGFVDPWGKPYMILYKTDGELKNTFKLYATGPEVKLLTPIAVYTVEGKMKDVDLSEPNRYATSWNGIITIPEN